MRIAIIEDNYAYRDDLRDRLRTTFDGAETVTFGTATEFRQHLENSEDVAFDLVISDALLIWNLGPPQPGWDVERGGLQMIQEMRRVPGLERVPVLLWALDSRKVQNADLPSMCVVVDKTSSPENLVNVITSLMIAVGKPPKLSSRRLRELSQAVSVNPGILGVSIDLMKLSRTIQGWLKKNPH